MSSSRFEIFHNDCFAELAKLPSTSVDLLCTDPLKHYANGMNDTDYDNPGTRHPTCVLRFARDAKSHHPTQKPEALCAWLIKSYSHPGDMVIDPFAGNGSTGVAAILEGRRFIGMEMDPQYHAIALERLQEAAGGQV